MLKHFVWRSPLLSAEMNNLLFLWNQARALCVSNKTTKEAKVWDTFILYRASLLLPLRITDIFNDYPFAKWLGNYVFNPDAQKIIKRYP